MAQRVCSLRVKWNWLYIKPHSTGLPVSGPLHMPTIIARLAQPLFDKPLVETPKDRGARDLAVNPNITKGNKLRVTTNWLNQHKARLNPGQLQLLTAALHALEGQEALDKIQQDELGGQFDLVRPSYGASQIQYQREQSLPDTLSFLSIHDRQGNTLLTLGNRQVPAQEQTKTDEITYLADEPTILAHSRRDSEATWQNDLYIVPFFTSHGEKVKVVGKYMEGDRLRFEVKNKDGHTYATIKRTQLESGEPVWMLPEHASLKGGAGWYATTGGQQYYYDENNTNSPFFYNDAWQASAPRNSHESTVGTSSVANSATPAVANPRAERLLRSQLSDIRLDSRLTQIVRQYSSSHASTIEWLNSDTRDLAIDNMEAGLQAWNPNFEPKTESDGEDDQSIARINPNDPTHRLQRTYDIAGVMRNEDPDSAYFISCKMGSIVLGLISIEPGVPPHVGDLLTHPGSSGVGRNLLRIASEYSQQNGGQGVFQLDAGDEAALARYVHMGLQRTGDRFLMRFEP